MNIKFYLGMPYDFRNEKGVNCWGLYALILKRELGVEVETFGAEACTTKAITAKFTAELAKGVEFHNHEEVKEPQDLDLIILDTMEKGIKKYHSGIFYKGRMLHARGTGRSGQVWYEELKEYKDWNARFFRYVN